MIRFGTLGAARITSSALIKPCDEASGASVYVVAARSRERAEAFASDHGIPQVVEDYEAVISHPEVNAVYIPLPISGHHEWTIKALEAGKHVLCEKSFASNAREAAEMLAVAEKSGLVLMDAFHYRYHPMFIRVKEIYESGQLGEIREVSSRFHTPVTDPNDIRMNYETAGGVTMDIGCYPVSMVRHMIGLEPIQVKARAELGPPDVDTFLATELIFQGDVKVTTSGDMRADATLAADILVVGQLGKMQVNNPIAPQRGNSLILEIGGETSREQFDRRPSYSYQLDAFIDAVVNGTSTFTDAKDALKQMQLIDRCYEAAGLKLRGLS